MLPRFCWLIGNAVCGHVRHCTMACTRHVLDVMGMHKVRGPCRDGLGCNAADVGVPACALPPE